MDNVLGVPNNSQNEAILDEYVNQKRRLRKCETLIREFMDEVYANVDDAETLNDFQMRWYFKFDNAFNLPF
tara:strand:- start:273 stop:485 length:213 start_codon:yes stop_codon:yes gene_type:complete